METDGAVETDDEHVAGVTVDDESCDALETVDWLIV